MEPRQCPTCSGPLEERPVSPCMMCGAETEAVEHHLTGLHGYSEYELFGEHRIVLCSFCALDFPRQDPTLFGRPADPPLEKSDLRLHARLERPEFGKDCFCPSCEKRLSYLELLETLRAEA